MAGRTRILRSLSILACLLAGCGGGAQSTPPASAGSASGGAATQLTVRIDVPQTGTAASRRAAYVSASTQSIAIAVLDAGNQPVGSTSLNLSTSSAACQLVTANGVTALACSIAMPVNITASGAYTIATATYDQAQTQTCSVMGTPRCAGNVLSASDLDATLALNSANVVSVVLGGLAAIIAVTPVVNGFFQGTMQTGFRLYGPQVQSFSVTVYDAGGNAIIGSGAPTVSVTSSVASVHVTNVSPGVYSLQAATSGSPAIITSGTATLTVTATPVNSPATPYSQAFSLAVNHTAVFVSNGSNVLVFLDGNTTSSGTLPNTSSPRGVAIDGAGTVYVGNHTSGGSVTECTAAGYYVSCTMPITGTPNVEGVAVDPSGNLWITTNGNIINEYLAGQSTPNLTIRTAYSTLRGVSVDTNGLLWAADQSTNTVAGYSAPLSSASTPFATLDASNGIAAPIQVSSDASGNLWVANSGSGAWEFAPPITSPSTAAIMLGSANGVNAPQGVAIDAVASVWIANSGNGTVTHCLPPAGTVPCTSFAVPGALWIAAYPSDIDPSVR
jgi:streptogramin lyase